MSLDYMYDAQEAIVKEGHPFIIFQFPPDKARYMWDMVGDGVKPVSSAQMVLELRRLATRIEQGQL